MFSRETTITWGAVGLALILLYVASTFTGLSDLVVIALVIGVGVLLPTLLNEYLNR